MLRNNSTLKSQLIEDINKSISVTELLLYQDLQVVIQRKPESVKFFFFPPEETEKSSPILPNFDEIIKLSLFHEYKQEVNNRSKLSDISANILADRSKNIMNKCKKDNTKRLFKVLRQFIFDTNNNRNLSSVNNFKRIASVAIGFKEEFFDEDNVYHYDDQFNINIFITFIIKNSTIFPYLELLYIINDDFNEHFPFVIDETLRYAAISCLHINEESDARRKFIKSKQDVYLHDDDDQKREENLSNLIETWPVNCETQIFLFHIF